MTIDTINKINRIPLRQVWKHEAHDFTTWLVDNLDVLNSCIDFSVVNAVHEQSAGSFSVDIVGEDANGNKVVIENQLEKSDHDHLGKLITYLTALEAKVGIWIVAQPRPEHVQAISWLNESGLAQFYLLKIEAIKIGESFPAPLLTLITGPSEEALEVGHKKQEYTERALVLRNFWNTLLIKSKEKTTLHSGISPSAWNWIGSTANLPH